MQLRPLAFIQASLAGLMVAVSGSSSLALTEVAASDRQPKSAQTLIAQSSPASNACDLDTRLAARVVRNALFERTYSTRSIMKIESTAPGTNLTLEAQVTTLTQAPGQFRSEIIFSDSHSQNPAEYLVISNGERAWIYDKIGDRYSAMSHEAFDDSSDSFIIGFTALLGLTIQADFNDIAVMRQLSEAQLAMAITDTMAPCQASGLSVALKTMNGQSYQTFSYEDTEDEFIMEGFMNRQTGRLDHVTLEGEEDGMELRLHEKIVSRTAMQEVAATTFEFIPPATAQETKEPISIGPF